MLKTMPTQRVGEFSKTSATTYLKPQQGLLSNLVKRFSWCLFLLASASLLALSACQSDETLATDDQTITLSYTLTLPEAAATRAYSDGLTATYLSYGVYRTDDEEAVLVSSVERKQAFADRQATVDILLSKGHAYKIVFWADAGTQCPYTLDLEAGTLTLDYADGSPIEANNEARDAFYALSEVDADVATLKHSVALNRPFAQLNYGTNDIIAPIIIFNTAIKNIAFDLTLPAGLPTELNLLTGEASKETTSAITFHSQGAPAESDGTFPVTGYDYLQMNYLLCGASNDEPITVLTSAEATLTASSTAFDNDVNISLQNLPLQRNYRTNVYGPHLTDPLTAKVDIEPACDDEFNVINYRGITYYAYYGTQKDMFLDAISKGRNVALMSDMTEDADDGIITMTGDQSIYLTGYELTVNGTTSIESYGSCSVNAAYSLSIYDGTLNLSRGIFAQSGTLTMDGVNLKAIDYFANYGIRLDGTASGVITNCEITNDPDHPATVGVMHYSSGPLYMENCIIYSGSSTEQSIGVQSSSVGCGPAELVNCTITNVCTASDQYSWGVKNTGGPMIIDGCTITASGASSYSVYGIENYTSSESKPYTLVKGGTSSYATNTGTGGAVGMNVLLSITYSVWLAYTDDVQYSSITQSYVGNLRDATVTIERDADGFLSSLTASSLQDTDESSATVVTPVTYMGNTLTSE